MTKLDPRAIDAARKAWDAARLIDDRLGNLDANRLRMWAGMFDEARIYDPQRAARAAVDWYKPGRDRVIQPGDITTTYRATARTSDRTVDEALQLNTAPPAITAPDNQLGGLPIAGADGKPIWTAYEQHGAIDLPCSTCDAQPNDACINLATGMTRRIPCMTRLRDGHRANTQDAEQQSPTTRRKTRPESTQTDSNW